MASRGGGRSRGGNSSSYGYAAGGGSDYPDSGYDQCPHCERTFSPAVSALFSSCALTALISHRLLNGTSRNARILSHDQAEPQQCLMPLSVDLGTVTYLYRQSLGGNEQHNRAVRCSRGLHKLRGNNQLGGGHRRHGSYCHN